jgi:hypothetical protein
MTLRNGALDLFGEVPVTRHDVYAWLLCVAGIDPASERAAAYVRGYGVVQKIVDAKVGGEFQTIADEAEAIARYRELVDHGLPGGSGSNPFGVGDWKLVAVKAPGKRRRMWRNRPKEVVAREKKRLKAERDLRKNTDASMLQRLPKAVPPLDCLLTDIGNPSAPHLAKAMRVTPGTAARWIREGNAPQAVMLALFWVTRWGASMVNANAHNDAALARHTAEIRSREVTMLQAELTRVEDIADFGSANDPSPRVMSILAGQATRTPAPEVSKRHQNARAPRAKRLASAK